MVEYPSFLKRFGAWALDAVILSALAMPVTLAGIWSLSFEWAAAATLAFGLFWYGYKIVTQAIWGQTIGKKVVGICLRMKDGAPVGWASLLVRYSPGLVYASLHFIGWFLTVRSAGWIQLQSASFVERGHLLNATAPFWWPRLLTWSMLAWLLANAIVLRNSVQSRALHDLIARTTVRRTEA
jgi:uncharacterized RDD family membrane protein YckC